MTPKSIVLGKKALSWGFQHRFMGFQGDRWENIHFRVNLGMWPLKSIVSENKPCSEVSTHIYGVSKEIDGKTFIRSFVCNTKRPVKQSIKLQMNSNLADEPSLANVLPLRIEKRCLEYQYTKCGRQTYCGRWPVSQIILCVQMAEFGQFFRWTV